jgi:hypothetical protein
VVLVLILAGARVGAHVLSELVDILIITAATVAGLALTTGAVAAVVIYRRRELARRAAIAPVARIDAPAIVRVLGPRELPDGRRDGPASLPPAAPSYALRDRARARWSR